jgi:RNA polymerase sigma-70 factor (ECF subfamily)
MAKVAPISEERFDALYLASRERLAAQIHALNGDWPGARDVVQEAFTRCWARWDRVAAYDDPEAWVRRVAYNLAKSGWRRGRRSVLAASPPAGVSHDADGAGRADLVVALKELPVKERTAIALHHLGGLSVEETAAEMDAPAGSVKSWLSRGRARLAAAIDPDRTPELPRHG